ncbi:lmo0937 family membrane protein [Lederbergia panacisoli]|nr:lmo0937 family membrane protein [Lederbergia panacisoli]MCR2823090.1 lmo0937 family membrane protein [Lederbergia panacisoli]
MLWTIVGILVVLWLLGFIAKIGGALIHILLIAALVLFIFNLVAGKKTR